jgi:glycosyltransferase involved in cell wall biosynthesis
VKRLSVITLTLNESGNIRDCLSSVSWADEFIVVDSGSTDETVPLAEGMGAKVLRVPWKGYGEAKNEALRAATGDWVLWLDADERVSEELSGEIRTILKESNDEGPAGYTVARRAYFLGRWIRHCGWYPARVVRLFRKELGKFSSHRVHEGLEITGEVGDLCYDIVHLTDPNLNHYFAKFNRYTTLAAEEMKESGKDAGLTDLVVRPWFTFVKMYVLKRGFLDGMEGFILCRASAAYVFAKYAKLWELRHSRASRGTS